MIDLETLNIRHASGKSFLIDSELSGFPYHRPIIINETGEEMFLLLKSGKSVEEAAEAMAEAYDAPKEQIAADIEAFLADIRKRYVVWEDRHD